MEINTLYELLDLNSKGDSLDQSRFNSKLFIKKAFQYEELEDLDLKSVLEHFRLVKSDLKTMLELRKETEPITTFFFTDFDLINSLLEMKEVMIGKNIFKTLDIFISMLNKEVENMIDEDTDERCDFHPKVLYEKKIGSSGEVTFFVNGKLLTTALIEEDLMKEVKNLMHSLTFERHFDPDSDYFHSISFDTNIGSIWGCVHNLGGKEPAKPANCFYLKNINIANDIKNLSRKEIVEFIKKDLQHIKVEDLDLPWIEIK